MSRRRDAEPDPVDGGMLIWGVIYGTIIGGITALLTLPRSGIALRQLVNRQIEAARPRDPIAVSIAEAKAAARSRMDALKNAP